MLLYTLQDFRDPAFPFRIEFKGQTQPVRTIPHAHEFFQICYVMKGCCVHKVNGQEAVLAKGDLFSIPPFYEHQLDQLPGKEIEIAQINFMPDLLDNSFVSFAEMESFVPFAFIQPFVELNDRLLPQLNLSYEGQLRTEALITEIHEELESLQVGYQLVIKSCLQKLLVLAGREYTAFMESKEEHSSLHANRQYFEQALAFIHERYQQEIKLQDAAAKATMSPAYFSTIFKMIKGKTFITYLNELRLGQAMKLLKQTDQSVQEIANCTGFNNSTHFHRMFKKTIGLTPAEYRHKSDN
ncbi:MAG: hypothetical protein K0R67_3639 [Paenibacillus sp.]|jgi:AraC-like DNA-binding protein|nr:hypothetical protein [Paenibacillus sp.]